MTKVTDFCLILNESRLAVNKNVFLFVSLLKRDISAKNVIQIRFNSSNERVSAFSFLFFPSSRLFILPGFRSHNKAVSQVFRLRFENSVFSPIYTPIKINISLGERERKLPIGGRSRRKRRRRAPKARVVKSSLGG